jgi:hypothetical protein
MAIGLLPFHCAGPGVPKIRPPDLPPVGGPVMLAFLCCPRCVWEVVMYERNSTPRGDNLNLLPAL